MQHCVYLHSSSFHVLNGYFAEIVGKLDSLNITLRISSICDTFFCFMLLSNYGHTRRAQQFKLTYVVTCGLLCDLQLREIKTEIVLI